jgi:hypothetical protein
MTFIDLIKNAIFEEEPQPKQVATSAPQGAPRAVAPASSPVVFTPPASSASPAASDNQFYARLVKQTEFSAVPELAKIEAFAAPLASIIPDKSLRYKAALATAQSQAGLTREAILNGFDSLLTVLNSSAGSFNKQSDEVGKSEVEGKTAQINQLSGAIQQKQKEIADLQQQVKSMQSEVDVSRSKLQQAKANFGAAFERRKAEIQQQRKEFENILQ